MPTLPTEHAFLQRFDHLLENTSLLLGVHLEIWTGPGGASSAHHPPETCVRCGRLDPEMFANCHRTRWARVEQAIEENDPQNWTCPRGLELEALPIQGLGMASGGLVSVGPGKEAEKASLPEGALAAPLLSLPASRPTPVDDAVYGELDPLALRGAEDSSPSENSVGADSAGGSSPLAGAFEIGASGARSSLPFPEIGQKRLESTPIPRRKRAFLLDLTRLLSDQMLMIREYSSLSGDLAARYEELHVLYSISGRLASHEDMRKRVRLMLSQARSALLSDAVLLAIGDRRFHEVVVKEGLQPLPGGSPKIWQGFTGALEQELARENRGYYAGALSQLYANPGLFPGDSQMIAVPVRMRDHPSGFLAFLNFQPERTFRMSDLKLAESLAEQIAMTVSNSDLYEDLKDFLMATVKSLVSAIEAKDSYTSGHSERVNLISLLIGKTMGLSPEELETLRWASILHDVGKIGMPECILNKPAALNAEEYSIMQEHPDRGYKVLAPIRQLSTPAIGVRAHHERVDGKGYPSGLSGQEIPLVARIISVADAFDALTTTRPYRQARPLDHAVQEILRVRGTQLDAEVVDSFLKMMPFLKEHHIMIHAAAESLREEEAA